MTASECQPKFYSRSHDAVIRVYDEAGNVIERHEHKGDFKKPWTFDSHHVTRPAKTTFMTPLSCSDYDWRKRIS
jgi:hypothetical protein